MKIYTDGSCSDNGMVKATCGWAIGIIKPSSTFELKGGSGLHPELIQLGYTIKTNNLAEVSAMIEALIIAEPNCTIYTDSQYAKNMTEGTWKAKDNLYAVVLLQELWKAKGSPKIEWVRGHSGDLYNEIVDKHAYEMCMADKER